MLKLLYTNSLEAPDMLQTTHCTQGERNATIFHPFTPCRTGEHSRSRSTSCSSFTLKGITSPCVDLVLLQLVDLHLRREERNTRRYGNGGTPQREARHTHCPPSTDHWRLVVAVKNVDEVGDGQHSWAVGVEEWMRE